MQELTLEMLRGIPPNGPTDPIEYYRRPLIGALFRRRINLGLRLVPVRRFRRGLEVGYGSGSLLPTLSDSVEEMHGIDLDADPAPVVARLRRLGRDAQLLQGSVYALPYPENHFDFVASFSTFEHLHAFPRGLAEIQRVLTPEGIFLLGMPSVNKTMEYLFHAIGHSTIDDIHVTTPRMVCDAFAAAGLELVREAYLDFPLPRPFGMRLYHNFLLRKKSR
jgi:ubiquinone/menaquinone biosynthesis C-methylase UbiE